MNNITIYDTASRQKTEVQREWTVEYAKEAAIGLIDKLGGLRGRSCKVVTPRAVYALVPRSSNRGPGRYVWVREQ